MTVSHDALRLPAHRSVLRFVHDRNPFFLLSALFMFVGFRIVLGALNAAPGDWKSLVGLIITLNLYEAVMIALALFLIVRRRLFRDGWILLAIEALFLADLTNLNAELFSSLPRLGVCVSIGSFVLAMLKITVVLRTLRLRLPRSTMLYIALQLAFMFGLPGIFRSMQSTMSAVSAWQIYGIWWLLAVLIVAGAMLVHRPTGGASSPMASLPMRLYVFIPFVSLLVHLASENRVYWVHFQPANVGPLIIALVAALNCSRLRNHRRVLTGSVLLLAVAVALSITPSAVQAELSGRWAGIALSPLRLVLITSGMVMLQLSIVHQSRLAAGAGVASIALSFLGSSPVAIATRTSNGVQTSRWAMLRLMPHSPLQWGYASIAMAFFMLAVGAWFSLGKRPATQDELIS